ncbi:ImmA/IrrE family metallo-endopeptidase [Tumebacillus sp. ITR2]|uniref:ImmA/IrrE family metallo-endopeptidase n=1 Tax=Tumebacillus amylolyticus TaxID=2801339 RepID=A0ABS1J7I2_9BACL|nr:ImmA/IrrE family metallo-endopeptidase [Tumebacillus amylolyticus]
MKFAELIPGGHVPSMMEDRANQLLTRFDFRYPDQIDIQEICDYFKIKVRASTEPDLTFSVCTGFRKGFIYIQKGVDYLHFKELCGEEFAHLYLHTISQTETTKHLHAKQERQAKDFSTFLYMPLKMMQDVMLSYDQAVDVSTLADEFLVSEEFVYYRLSLLFPDRVDAIARAKGRFGYVQWLE